MRIKSLAHVCLKVGDLAQTTAFYCDVLGMQKAFGFTRKGHIIGFYLKAGNDTFIEVFHDSEVVRGGPGQPLNHFCLETDSIDALWSRLTEHGYAAGQIIMGADNALAMLG